MRKASLTLLTVVAVGLASLAPLGASEADPMGTTNRFWWPQSLDLSQLRAHDARSNPYGDSFDYAAAFNIVDLDALKKEIESVLTTSQDW